MPIRTGMAHWPGDPDVSLEQTSSIDAGDAANMTKLEMSAHTGTHMDAPRHFLPEGAGIDSLPPAVTIGPARVIAVEDAESTKADELRGHEPKPGERLLIRTRNSPAAWQEDGFVEDFVHLTTEAAELLADVGVGLVGVDYLSVAGYERNEPEVHRALLGAGVWIIEGLDLSAVEPGEYELVCLPLRLAGCDGAPARALLRTSG